MTEEQAKWLEQCQEVDAAIEFYLNIHPEKTDASVRMLLREMDGVAANEECTIPQLRTRLRIVSEWIRVDRTDWQP